MTANAASRWHERLATQLKAWLAPIVETDGQADKVVELFRSTGWHIESLGSSSTQNLAGAVGQIASAGASLCESLLNPPDDVEAFLLAVVSKLAPVVRAIPTLANSLPAGLPPSASELPGDLMNWLTVEWLRRHHGLLYRSLRLTGAIRNEPMVQESFNGAVYRTKGAVPRFSAAVLVRLLREPELVLTEAFWAAGVSNEDGALALAFEILEFGEMLGLTSLVPLESLTESFDPDEVVEVIDPDTVRLAKALQLADGTSGEVGVSVKMVAVAAGGPGAVLSPFGELTGKFDLGVARLELKGTKRENPIQIDQAGVRQVDVSLAPAALNVKVARGDASSPAVSIGKKAGIQLSVETIALSSGMELPSGRPRALIGLEIERFRLVLSAKGADGFLSTILPGDGIQAESSVAVEWSTDGGVALRGSGGLSIALPMHIQVGPIEISDLVIDARPSGRALPIELATTFRAKLGPLAAVVEQVGTTVALQFPDGGGNVGPLDVAIAFKPPKGVGLSIDAGVVKGGGYLFIDSDRGEYAGALELSFAGFISLKAIGLITTKMPDGSKGFSLLIIITAEFGAGFQLGFGFVLLGVGGLLGLNRTVRLQALMEGVRTGAINGIMFPRDVVANAPRIISDLRTIFPPQEGTFLIGPMAKLGWGTPALITVSLGVIIEIPGNIAILGVLKVVLPTEEASLIRLQVNFAGAIEFDKKRIYFYAALFDSRVLFMTIDGGMGLLVAYGDDANFVVSVGGFHPRFSPPPLPFPSPHRVSIPLVNTPVYRVLVEGYFAVTTNTAQFGARAELFFGLDDFNIRGHISFDALFQFSPFYFVIEISAKLSVKVFGAGLFSVRIRGSLGGPAPWHIEGHGGISLLFWDIDVDFEKTWGERRDTQLPPIAVMPILERELNKPENWQALLPPRANLFVSVRKMPPEETALILHPVGVLRVSQRAVPLELTLDKVGTQKPNDVNRLFLNVLGGALAKKADAFELFAPAQFQELSDSDKLSRPAFSKERSGVDLSASGADVRSSGAVKRIVRYEEIILDTNYKRFKQRFSGISLVLFNHFLAGAAVTHSELSKAVKSKLQPFEEKISVQTETFTVALQSNNKAFAPEATSFPSEASARDYLNDRIAADPTLAETIHVIPSCEMAP
jgi:hypothetical protein